MIYVLSLLFYDRGVRFACAALGCAWLAAAFSGVVKAEEGGFSREENVSASPRQRTHLKAEQVTHDRELDVITARGHVEIVHGQRKVTADIISYQRSLDRLIATGHVTVTDADGTVTQTNYAELTGDLKDGFVRRARVLFVDGAHATARQATRTDGAVTVLQDASYSACRPCRDRSPLWHVRAKEVTHDQKNRTVSYKHAWLNLRDIPILYTPYLSQPDPSVKRQSGLLTPSYHSNKDLGFSVKVPWFIAISDRQDVTVAPIVTTKEGLVLTAEHRAVAQKTSLSSSGSLTKDSRDDIRGHITSTLRYSIDDTWRAGVNMNVASDRTYLRRYRLNSSPFLESRAYLEGFTRRGYMSLEGLHFQNTGDARRKGQESATVIPLGTVHYTSQPGGFLGSWSTFDFGLAGLHWEGGRRSQRLSSHAGWHVPYTSPGGSVYRADFDVYADAWHMDRVSLPSRGAYTGAAGRVVPEAMVTWSLPLYRSQGARRDVLEPIIQGIVSPRGGNPLKVANNDSLDFEISDSNLFSRQRSPGRDRIETGPRLNYGVRYTAYGTEFGTFESVFGQSWRAHPDAHIPTLSGLNETFSDYVGRVSLTPHPNFSTSWRFRLDQETGALRRGDTSVSAGYANIKTTLGHVVRDEAGKNDPNTSLPYQRRQEIYGSVESRLSSYWNAAATARWDLTEGGGPLSTKGKISYEDECFVFSLEAGRDYMRDGDFSGGTFVGLTLSFKTLGDFTTKF